MSKIFTFRFKIPNAPSNRDFKSESKNRKMAGLKSSDFVGRYFISEDRFFQLMYFYELMKVKCSVHNAGMTTRNDFCCKEKLKMFVHRMVHPGLFKRIYEDFYFWVRLTNFRENTDSDPETKLTLIHVAPAFIFCWWEIPYHL